MVEWNLTVLVWWTHAHGIVTLTEWPTKEQNQSDFKNMCLFEYLRVFPVSCFHPNNVTKMSEVT